VLPARHPQSGTNRRIQAIDCHRAVLQLTVRTANLLQSVDEIADGSLDVLKIVIDLRPGEIVVAE
jgi:hypothetical protein